MILKHIVANFDIIVFENEEEMQKRKKKKKTTSLFRINIEKF